MIEHGLAIAKVVIVIMMVLNLVPILIWMERKGAAYIQDRRGPNRAALFGIIRLGGLIHSLADAIKLITKGDTTNEQAYSPLFILAPMIIGARIKRGLYACSLVVSPLVISLIASARL